MRDRVTGNLAGAVVAPLAPEDLTGQPYPERCVELGFPKAAVATDVGLLMGPLTLRTTPVEAAALALQIHEALGAAAFEEARRLAAHGRAGTDTGVLLQLRDGLQRL